MAEQKPRAPTQAAIGTCVELELLAGDTTVDRMTADIVFDKFADLTQDFLGASAPLAKAIVGKPMGASVAYAMGDITHVYIVSVARSVRTPPADAADQRQAILDEARRKAERTNAEMFASSYGSKWGNYEVGDDGE
jgi:hypothetical protein